MCDISIFLTADGQFDLQSYAATYDMDSNYGKNWIEYKSPNNPLLYSDPNLLRSTSLVHVNFIRNQATVTLKDARVTFADMIGTIGGTFGVFIGLSFGYGTGSKKCGHEKESVNLLRKKFFLVAVIKK